MLRECPKCAAKSVKVSDLLFGDSMCSRCGAIVGGHRVALWVANLIIGIASLVTTLMVLVQSGLYAALIWFPFPVGALSYMKARFSPLQVRSVRHE